MSRKTLEAAVGLHLPHCWSGADRFGMALTSSTARSQQLAEVDLGPGAKFPPFDNPPSGHVIRNRRRARLGHRSLDPRQPKEHDHARRGLYALVEEQVHSSSAAAGRTVADIDWPPSCVLVAVLRGADVITPRGPTLLLPGDEVLAVIHSDATSAVAALLGPGHAPAM